MTFKPDAPIDIAKLREMLTVKNNHNSLCPRCDELVEWRDDYLGICDNCAQLLLPALLDELEAARKRITEYGRVLRATVEQRDALIEARYCECGDAFDAGDTCKRCLIPIEIAADERDQLQSQLAEAVAARDAAIAVLDKWREYRFRCADTPGATETLDELLYEAEDATAAILDASADAKVEGE